MLIQKQKKNSNIRKAGTATLFADHEVNCRNLTAWPCPLSIIASLLCNAGSFVRVIVSLWQNPFCTSAGCCNRALCPLMSLHLSIHPPSSSLSAPHLLLLSVASFHLLSAVLISNQKEAADLFVFSSCDWPALCTKQTDSIWFSLWVNVINMCSISASLKLHFFILLCTHRCSRTT